MSLSAEAVAELARALRIGQRRALARAITLVESRHADHQTAAEALLQQLLPCAGNALRIGVSGAPGVGKSTFIEALGMHIIGQGRRVAVLSVDPSSVLSGGSILGDKSRMAQLARHPHAYIRPTPAAGALGGVARRTREAIVLCEAAGFDTVLVETVGVGQSEVAVARMTDMFVLLLMPAAGDELQGIKRGVMELADLVLINKADGDWLGAATHSAADYRNALRLMQPRIAGWQTPVELCSALTGAGIGEAWAVMLRFLELLQHSGELGRQREAQRVVWLDNEISEQLLAALKSHPHAQNRLVELQREVRAGKILPPAAARQALMAFLQPATP
ncbi:MAG: methylmalonyl Co-A mutase-associated GTPase MeaB [Gammaproteobacteria bacterium]